MRIQAINANLYSNSSTQNKPSFGAIWVRLGEDVLYRTDTVYHTAGMYSLKNGLQKPTVDLYNGKRTEVIGAIDMTVEEGTAAYKFLYEGVQTLKGYKAAKKLITFVQSKMTDDQDYNTMFIEEKDVANPNNKKQQLDISDMVAKVTKYEKANNIK